MIEAGFSSRILRRFAETVALELGADQFNAMLGLSKLPAEWAKPESFLKLDALDAAHAYASLQFATRSYFGRGEWDGEVTAIRFGSGRVTVGQYRVDPPPEVMRRQLPVRVVTAKIKVQWKQWSAHDKTECNVGSSVEVFRI